MTVSPYRLGIEEEFQRQTARLIALRTPIAMLAFMLSVGVSWMFEHRTHPERNSVFALVYGIEAIVCCLAVLAVRATQGAPRRQLRALVLSVGLLTVLLTAYFIQVSGEAELLALVLVYAVVGPMVIFPWGVRGQLGAVCTAVVCYIVALNTTARPSTDVGLGLFGVVIIGGFTLGTAGFLERYRLGFFRQTEALRRANAALEDASRTKTEFLADVSHELRTPLNVMIGYLQMLEEGAFGELPPGSNEPLLRMRHSTEMLLGLVNDFLDLSRLESRNMKLRTENVDLTPLLNEVAGLVRPLLRGKPIDLVVTQGDGLVVSADRSRVRQVVVNLLTNAAKFTSNGRIELRARPVESGRIAIEVADTGPGIPQDERDTIFEPYHRSAQTSHLGGVGIGLALSRQLTEAMGGSITVDSEPGGGARFSVRLPSVSTVAPAHG